MNPRWLLLLPVTAGVVFLGVGVSLFTDDAPAKELQRVEALAHVTAAPLDRVGQTLLVQGHLSKANPPVYREFIACSRALFEGWEDDTLTQQPSPTQATPHPPSKHEKWRQRDVLAPALVLDLEGGSIAVSQNYRLANTSHQVKDDVHVSLVDKAPEALSGFYVGDLVTVEGRVDSPGTITASSVEGGDLQAFVGARRTTVTANHVLGLVFMPLGSTILLGTALLVWRARRSK
jgi:hypothetical protein